MVVIEQIVELPVSELGSLVADSTRAGWRIVARLIDEWASGQNRFDRAGEALLMARAGGRVIGVCGLNVDPFGDSPHIGRVRRLYVSTDHRRRGVGRQLVEQVIVLSRGTFRVLRLRTNTLDGARFYERLGFHPVAGVAECTHVLELAAPGD